MNVLEAVNVLARHQYRLVCDDPYTRSTWSKYCVICANAWPCSARMDADWTLRLADELLAAHEARAE